MLNLRAHVQTWAKWFGKGAMGGGKKNPYHACRTLVSDIGISGRASQDLMQETEAAMDEYLA
eukprot:12921649-Prorocentrum_lima.AAC.1